MGNIDVSGGAAEGRWIEGFSQVVCVFPNGREAVVEPCVSSAAAAVVVQAFNRCSAASGRVAEARPLRLACLASNVDRKSQRALGIKLRRLERVS